MYVLIGEIGVKVLWYWYTYVSFFIFVLRRISRLVQRVDFFDILVYISKSNLFFKVNFCEVVEEVQCFLGKMGVMLEFVVIFFVRKFQNESWEYFVLGYMRERSIILILEFFL